MSIHSFRYLKSAVYVETVDRILIYECLVRVKGTRLELIM